MVLLLTSLLILIEGEIRITIAKIPTKMIEMFELATLIILIFIPLLKLYSSDLRKNNLSPTDSRLLYINQARLDNKV